MILLALAGLAGAAGVGLAAVAAHGVPSTPLSNAALLLIVHAAAVVGFASLSVVGGAPWLWVAALMLAGAALFTGDVAAMTLANFRLFPYAAPTGGMLMIASWLAASAVAIANLVGAR